MEKVVKKGLLVVLSLVMTLGLVGCSGESDEDYVANVYELSEDEQVLVDNPSEEYVITALSQIESIIGIEAASSGVKGAKDTIYFSSSLVDQSEFDEGQSVESKGTSAGGSIDIYETLDEAIERDEYLHSFDDSIILNSGSHAVVGTIVIRISEKLDKAEQEAFTDEIVATLTSGNITEEMIQHAMENYNQQVTSSNSEDDIKESEVSDNKIEMTFSHNDIYYKHYTDVYSMLEKLGFTNIDYEVSEMNYTLEEQFDGAVIAVRIDGEWEFEKGSIWEADLPVVISYVEDLGIQVPKASIDCEGLDYKDVVSLFENAGFTNVEAYANEIEYTSSVSDKTVLLISIDDNAVFDADAKFSKDAKVEIYYYVILPAPVESESPSDTTPNDSVSNENDDNTNQDNGETINSQTMVWIPQSGSKYHSRSSCSNMKNPTQVTKEEAVQMGYEPCKRCH